MILYFTGTGNSRLVAQRLAELLDDTYQRIEYPLISGTSFIPGKRLVWVFPVYSWGIPPIVIYMIKNIKLTDNGISHFMVCTCGDDIGLTAFQWRSLIKSRGWKAVGCWSVQMPNIYVLLPGFNTDPFFLADEKLKKAVGRTISVARAIRHEARVDDVVRGSIPWIKSKVLYPLFVRFMMSPRPFRSTEKCIGCAKCEATCPMQNIVMENKHPVWGKRCALCLGCYHICPVHAIDYGNRTKAKGQYWAPPQLPPG